jgi:hypothetical protein
MGGAGSGMGIRFSRRRTKRFVHDFNALSSGCFKYQEMQKLSDHGVELTFQGVKIIVKKNRLEISRGVPGNAWILYVPLSLSKTNYGNYRYWLKCPYPYCQKRCGRLYLYKNPEPVFLCRICLNLVYLSQNKTRLDRLIAKKWTLIDRLEANMSAVTAKPKWMHTKTFNRHTKQLETQESEIDIAMGLKFSYS